jgi:hypothetical protein
MKNILLTVRSLLATSLLAIGLVKASSHLDPTINRAQVNSVAGTSADPCIQCDFGNA